MQCSLAESICTHYSNSDIFLGSGTFKELGTLLFSKSRVQKNRVIFIQKEKRPGCIFSFWITMTLVFCTLLFQKAGCPVFFQGHKPTLVFKTRIVGADWLGEWTLVVDSGVHYLNFDQKNRKLGIGPWFMIVNPGVHYQGPLPSPILTVQALQTNKWCFFCVFLVFWIWKTMIFPW